MYVWIRHCALKRAIAAIILVLSCAAPVAADSLRDASVAWAQGDYATALRLFRLLADQEGYAFAQNNIGMIYANGRGVPQDHVEAAKWYRRAADQGYVFAQINLGVAYADGRGVSQDYAEAVRWYRKAAEQNNAQAQAKLALMYFDGRGVPQNYVHAYMWCALAAARYPASDTKDQDGVIALRDRIAAKMTPAQIAQAQELASQWRGTSNKVTALSPSHLPPPKAEEGNIGRRSVDDNGSLVTNRPVVTPEALRLFCTDPARVAAALREVMQATEAKPGARPYAIRRLVEYYDACDPPGDPEIKARLDSLGAQVEADIQSREMQTIQGRLDMERIDRAEELKAVQAQHEREIRAMQEKHRQEMYEQEMIDDIYNQADIRSALRWREWRR